MNAGCGMAKEIMENSRKSIKAFWDNMTELEKADFCQKRKDAQMAKGGGPSKGKKFPGRTWVKIDGRRIYS